MEVAVAVLASIVAMQYAIIGLYVVPRLARLADRPGMGGIRLGQWGAALFFLGCAITHVGIAVHTLTGPGVTDLHLLGVHVWPHLAQIAGGAAFIYIAARRLEIRFGPKGQEEDRRRVALEQERAAALLAQRAREQAAVARLGHIALQTNDPAWLMSQTVQVVSATLDVELCKVLEMLPSGDGLRVVAGVGWAPGVVGETVVPSHRASQAGYTLYAEEPIVVEDLATEERFPGHGVLHEHGVTSGVTVVIGGRPRPFGVLGVHTRERRRFSEQDINFLTSIANVLAAAIERAAADEDNQRRALYDPLTGLANRARFLDRLERAVTDRKRHPRSVAVLFLDLDNFKTINDTLGHSAGDDLLRAVAGRLTRAVRASDTLARFGGDEFALLCVDARGEREVVTVAERIAAELATPFTIAGSEQRVTASIGIAVADSHVTTAETMLRDADIAMYRAKEKGRAGYEMFDEDLRQRTLERLRLEGALRAAAERRELRLVYQPIVSLTDRSTTSVEALLRWDHPELGSVPPSEFIPIAEQTGLIVPIGTWALDEACRQFARWRCERPDTVPAAVAVNVSAHQLIQPGFVDRVAGALRAAGVEPHQLSIELTETVLMQTSGTTMTTLAGLRGLGVSIVLDDFGTGYSSLSYLERFPIDGIKIDRSFVAGLGDKPTSPGIFAAVVRLASELGIAVVAEGVETDDQEAHIRALGCTVAQGYLFGHPQPAQQLDERASGAAPAAGATVGGGPNGDGEVAV